jgi:hypothetical protein
LGAQQLLVHLLDHHLLLAQILVAGSILKSELDLLLLFAEVVQHCCCPDFQQGSAPPQHQVCQQKLVHQQLKEPPLQ